MFKLNFTTNSHQRELKIEVTCKLSKTIKYSTMESQNKMINKGDYDIITLDENDELQLYDVSELLLLHINDEQEIKTFDVCQSDFIIKCNLCNCTFLTIEQFQEHNHGLDHKKNKVTNEKKETY